MSEKMAIQQVLVVEDNILHMALITEQLTVRLGIKESQITCMFDGELAIKEIEQNIVDHMKDP